MKVDEYRRGPLTGRLTSPTGTVHGLSPRRRTSGSGWPAEWTWCLLCGFGWAMDIAAWDSADADTPISCGNCLRSSEAAS